MEVFNPTYAYGLFTIVKMDTGGECQLLKPHIIDKLVAGWKSIDNACRHSFTEQSNHTPSHPEDHCHGEYAGSCWKLEPWASGTEAPSWTHGLLNNLPLRRIEAWEASSRKMIPFDHVAILSDRTGGVKRTRHFTKC